MNPHDTILLRCLRDPRELVALDGRGIEALLASARCAKVLAKLAQRALDAGIDDQLNPRFRDHLIASRVLAQHYRRSILWEAGCIQRVLAPLNVPVVFLKGAAYVLADLPAGRGRFVNDIDAMVPKAALESAEQLLLANGWRAMKLDNYDQRYYRQWMHELPPLEHKQRRVVTDLHHTILPESGRLKPDAGKLFAASRGVRVEETKGPSDPATQGESETRSEKLETSSPTHPLTHSPTHSLRVLSPCDMILHSAAHLFQDGDLAGGLRDLLDLDDLLRDFGGAADRPGREPDFWKMLVPRAVEMDLHRPLFYALRFTSRLLDTPVPAQVLREAAQAGGPIWPTAPLMDFLANRAMMPDFGESKRLGAASARWMLYVRSHWLRMPPLLLAQHLGRKALRRWSKEETYQPRTHEEKNVDAKRVA